MHKLIQALLASILYCWLSFASAEVSSIPLPGDNKLVVFTFDANNTFTVLARPKSVTDIALHPSENIVAMAVGDTTQWVITKTNGHVFIKPIFPDIATTATLVTDQRTYQLTLRSSPENGKFYQRVSWDYPEVVIFEQQQRQMAQQRQDAERQKLEATVVTPGVALEKLNWDYKIDGDAVFKPKMVFDDGRFTWIMFPKIQELPAIFMLSEESKKGELLNYNLRGPYLVIQRLVPTILLKLGDKEIRIVNNTMNPSKSFFGVFN